MYKFNCHGVLLCRANQNSGGGVLFRVPFYYRAAFNSGGGLHSPSYESFDRELNQSGHLLYSHPLRPHPRTFNKEQAIKKIKQEISQLLEELKMTI